MKTFDINMLITREKNDSEIDDMIKMKSEITSWLEDLGFSVEFEIERQLRRGFREAYHSKAKDILWEYVSRSDTDEIIKRLDKLDEIASKSKYAK